MNNLELRPEHRTPCSPDERTSGNIHKHLCPECKTCWKHDGAELEECTTQVYRLAHCCPDCGTEVRQKHYTPEEETQTDRFINLLAAILKLEEELS